MVHVARRSSPYARPQVLLWKEEESLPLLLCIVYSAHQRLYSIPIHGHIGLDEVCDIHT